MSQPPTVICVKHIIPQFSWCHPCRKEYLLNSQCNIHKIFDDKCELCKQYMWVMNLEMTYGGRYRPPTASECHSLPQADCSECHRRMKEDCHYFYMEDCTGCQRRMPNPYLDPPNAEKQFEAALGIGPDPITNPGKQERLSKKRVETDSDSDSEDERPTKRQDSSDSDSDSSDSDSDSDEEEVRMSIFQTRVYSLGKENYDACPHCASSWKGFWCLLEYYELPGLINCSWNEGYFDDEIDWDDLHYELGSKYKVLFPIGRMLGMLRPGCKDSQKPIDVKCDTCCMLWVDVLSDLLLSWQRFYPTAPFGGAIIKIRNDLYVNYGGHGYRQMTPIIEYRKAVQTLNETGLCKIKKVGPY